MRGACLHCRPTSVARLRLVSVVYVGDGGWENLRRWRPGWWPLAALAALLPRAVRDRRSGRVPVVAA